MDRMREQAGVGLDTIGAGDILIPRLTILQGLSPQVTQGRPEYDPNARVGHVYDVGLRETFADGVRVVIVYYTKVWQEWQPRQSGKGIVRTHSNNAIMSQTRPGQNGQPTLPNGNVVMETAEFYALNLSARGRKSFIPMASTQLKEAKRLNNYITSEEVTDRQGKTFRPPIFYRTYDLTSVPTSNAKGTWMLWQVKRGPLLSEVDGGEWLFDEALRFRTSLTKGEARGDMAEGEAETQADLPWSDNGGQRRNEGPL
jgi:hypothetical protein